MKNKILLICGVGFLVVMGLVVYNFSALQRVYYEISRKDGIIKLKTDDEQYTVYEYRHGKLYSKHLEINGQFNGLAYRYYDNGKVEKKLYINNKTSYFKEFGFSPNGGLSYIGGYFKLKKYGSWNFYKDGHLDSYKSFDADGEPYFTTKYSKKGNLVNSKGLILSEVFFSVDQQGNVVILKDTIQRKYSGIRDLYLTVAIPKYTKLYISVDINGTKYTVDKVINNTITIKNVFENKGVYEIFVETHLFDRKRTIINGVNMKRRIVKV